MKKSEKQEFFCSNCGQEYKQWVGKCKACNEWNCIQEAPKNTVKNKKFSQDNHLTIQSIAETNHIEITHRHNTNISELNRVLGGGLVNGTTILLSGEPGIGKSTLLLQLCDEIAKQNMISYYISGEESIEQVRVRANRMQVKSDIKVITTTSLFSVLSLLESIKPPGIVVIDSIQTLNSENVDSTPGSVAQVKACTLELVNRAKALGICMIIVGHINKEGQIAGPKLLEHMVDVVLSFESDNTSQYRIIRGIKNRYGATNEIGIFEMSNSGLIEVFNPSKIFLPTTRTNISGSCIFAGVEGTRGVLIEVQALVAPSYIPTPRRAAIGWDYNRLSMIIAILNSRMGINIMDKEVYLNVAGGTKITDTGIDLAVAVALLSAHKNIIIPYDTVFIGEIGLLGELRIASHLDVRIKESIKLGFKNIITHVPFEKCTENIINIKHIREIIPLLMK